ncbi:hypothetical protein OH799_31410 [Nocardia sp. NBC_00881]|uniref:hypothetical protein n=1 Tax=Nocardia sp. NBC_00881 TaxID=2975995 RepID=UPI00386494E3|nr:hypothetical protein OH799_31410 [Nocardia sp. NBC_00881]
MTDRLDIDEPHEVVASQAKWSTSLTTVGGQAEGVSNRFDLPRRPESEIDRRLVKHTDWMKTTFERAVKANRRRAAATDQHTNQVSSTYEHEDRAGGARIHRTELL